MFFNVCEHYDDNQPIVKEHYDECFICFEYKTHDENILTTLQKQKIYLNNCTCNGSIHNYCLKIWFDKNKSCPICRIHFIENNNATIVFLIIFHMVLAFIYLSKTYLLNLLNFFLLFYFFMH